MELNIEELTNMNDFQVEENPPYENPPYENPPYENLTYENPIEEKEKPKPSVRFVEPPRIPRQIPRQVVSKQPVPRQLVKPVPRPTMSYDDILAKMGMYVDNGKLHLMNTQVTPHPHVKKEINQPQQQLSSALKSEMKNSYIYNKYFKHELKEEPQVRIPKTKEEYKQMLISRILERERIKRIKSKKLIMNTNNIHMYTQPSQMRDFNKLFQFSHK